MPLGSRRVFVEFSPTRQELTLLSRHEVVAVRSELTDPIDSERRWQDMLPVFQARLARWVNELGLSSAQAVVLYSSPDVAAHVFTCAASAGADRSRRAAELALSEAVPFDLETNPNDCAFLWRDRRDGVAHDRTARPAQVHHLAAADTIVHAEALSACVRAAGLSPALLVPFPAAAVTTAVAELRERASPGGIHAIFWIGEHHAVLAAGDKDRLLLLRLLPVGSESLVDALSRPVKSGDGGTQCVFLDRATARRQLAGVGVRDSDDAATEPGAIDPSLVLPLLQPVLQKLSLEAKHSLRFGLCAEDRDGLRFHLAGPGARIQGLERAVLSECAPGAAVASVKVVRSDPSAHLRAALSAGLNLLPREQVEALQAGRLRRALWAGVTAAVLGIGVDAMLTVRGARDTDRVLAQLKLQESTPDPSRDALMRAVSLQQTVAAARLRLGRALRDVPEWAAVLSHIADTTPEQVHLTSLTCVRENEQWVCRVAGIAGAGEGGTDGVQVVRTYVNDLGSAPVVAQARLGATHRARIAGAEQLAFELTLALVPLPRTQTPILDAGIAHVEETP